MKPNPQILIPPLKFVVTVLISLFCFLACDKEETRSTAKSENVSSGDASVDTAIITNGLVAWYTFKNGSLDDKSGKGNNIVFSNAMVTADKNGNATSAYLFNGSSYMRVPNSPSLQLTNKITIFATVKVNGFYAGGCHGNRIVQKGYDDNTAGTYVLGFDDAYYYNSNNCSNPVDTNHQNFIGSFGNSLFDKAFGVDSNFIKKGKWYSIAYTYDGSVIKVYQNGTLKTSNSKSITLTPNSDDLFIGMTNINNAGFPYWFNGVIDEIRIYKRALSAAEIKQLSGQ
ncbi:MAG TPA: LamG domain-containing protein [Parafilimonas sp.]|nr:LamG domain-containing protein [Parafilimonas sp.]